MSDHTPSHFQFIGSEFAVAWSDGVESYFELETLRRACPCAVCAGEPELTGKIQKPSVNYTDSSFQLKGWTVVGGYAIQPQWADGHQTGIYSWRYLRALHEHIEKEPAR